MQQQSLALVGFGNVGRALARLLEQKRSWLRESAGIEFRVTGIATGRHGLLIDADGIDLETALALVERGEPLNHLARSRQPQDVFDFLRTCAADVMFESTPVNHATGQPASDYLLAALQNGMHAITANKGPVVHAYRQLREAAAQFQRRFLFESAVMDGAPIFSLFRGSLPGAELMGFDGILNSCTNLLLERMEAGESFDDAVRYAQSIGITETDPGADIDGWDAAIKVAALATVLMGAELTPQQVHRTGIRAITPAMISEARAVGRRWKLICSAQRQDGQVVGRVAPQQVGPDSPFYTIHGTSSCVQFALDVLPGLAVVENDPGPQTTAYGMLADWLNALRGV